MKLNCKLGDLAIIIRSESPEYSCFIGSAVKLVGTANAPHSGRPGWIFEKCLTKPNGLSVYGAIDQNLRPLRDQPGKDESPLWAPVPTTHKEKA